MNNSTNVTLIDTGQKGDIQKAALYVAIAFGVIFINIMTMISYSLRKKNKRGIPDVFMLSLAVSAILTMLAVILILAYVRATGNEYFEGLMGACYVQVYFGTLLRCADVAITTAITIDRFLALYKPLFYRVTIKLIHGKIACVILWLLAGVIALLPLVGFGSVSMKMQSFCTANWTSEISYVVLSFAYVQFIIVLICYIGIFRSISGLVNRQKAMSRSQTLSYSTNTKHPVLTNKYSTNSFALAEDVFQAQNVSRNGEEINVSYNNNNQCFEDDITKTIREISNTNFKSAFMNSVKENDDIKLQTKVKIKTFEKKKISSETSEYYTTMKSSVDLSIKTKLNRVSWSDIPEDSEDSEEKDVIASSHVQVFKKSEVNRTQSCPVITTPIKKTLSENDDIKLKRCTNKRSLRNISVAVKEKIKGSKLKRNPSSSMKNFWAENQRFAKVMGVVVLLFYISWLPLAISINIVLVTGMENSTDNYYNILWISYNLSLISSVAIPIAYAVMCKPYRAAYIRLWSCIKIIRITYHSKQSVNINDA